MAIRNLLTILMGTVWSSGIDVRTASRISPHISAA